MASSTSNPSSSPYIGQGGPGFDPEAQFSTQAPEQEEQAQPTVLIEWDEERVTSIAQNLGGALHETFGVAERDWEMTQKDLERIVPPATRILQRYDPAGAAAAVSDPAALSLGLALYTWRSGTEMVRVKRAEKIARGAQAPPDVEVPAPGSEAGFEAAGPTAAEQLRQAHTFQPEEDQ